MKTDSPLVLIVEDNPADFALISEELGAAIERGSFRLENVQTLAAARTALAEREVAAVLLDLSLPDSQGLETFDAVVNAAPNIPIVVLTGLDDGELGLAAVRNGAQDYLVKGKIDALTLERTLHYSVERKRRETELRQRQSLEVMAQFADSIATDFNDLLQVLLGQLQALEWPLREDPELRDKLRAAADTVVGGAELTRRLLAVTGRLPDQPALLDANTHVAKLAESLAKSFEGSTSVRTELSAGAWPVFADPAQLDMTILNIVNNAREAMLGLGEVTIRTSNLTIGEPNAAELPAGDYLVIEIRDIGDGLTAEEQKNLFQPFLAGRGDMRLKGLGLHMTQNFVRASGGHVGVRSARGEGTTVSLYLPRAEASPEPRARHQQTLPVRRPQNVLVVEDDAEMRQALTGYLWQLGYPTFEADCAADAFALLDSGEIVSLVVVDRRGVSGIAGDELVRKMARVQPGLKVLFLTSTGAAPAPDLDLPAGACAALAKPARISDMQERLAGLLGEARPAA